jgi:O-6-methylguanine DNA methyltransferase
MKAYLDMSDSPAGSLVFAVDDRGALIRASFARGNYTRTIEEELEDWGWLLTKDPGMTSSARTELQEYAAGERREFDLTLSLFGSEWQRSVWESLVNIPFGQTRTYSQVAEAVERPRAARAVGRAVATNPVPVVVPCHRVIGADGSLTGFSGGVHLKERLLEHEGRIPG